MPWSSFMWKCFKLTQYQDKACMEILQGTQYQDKACMNFFKGTQYQDQLVTSKVHIIFNNDFKPLNNT
jgi:hypothetical protein